MYHVIIVLDQSKNKRYYHSYVSGNGNVECEELPPYQDINKARACYWDGEKWIYDADKYVEIVTAQAAEKAAAEQVKKEAEAVPTNEELAIAIMELADNVNILINAAAELGSAAKGGE